MTKFDGPFGTDKPVSNGYLTCRLCETAAWMQFVHSEKGYHIVQCPHCDFISTDPVPSNAELEQFYSTHFLKGESSNIDYWEVPRQPVFAQIETIIQNHNFDNTAKILDVGAAYGAFLKFLLERNYHDLTGIDLSEPAVKYLNKELKVTGICADLTAANLDENSYDVICLIDTLEHLPNFKAIIHESYRILRPQGILIVRVPNMDFHLLKTVFLNGMQWQSPYGQFTPPAHLNHFSPKGLGNLVEMAGFDLANRYNGVPDLVGGAKRKIALQAIYSIANIVRCLSSKQLLIGNSQIITARKTV